jgi:putative pyruvate formate lyase activating enzyme
MTFKPAYLKSRKSGLLQKRIRLAYKLLSDCTLCPRNCRVNRLENEKGTCKTGRHAMVSSLAPHFGEESPLVGIRGSGTIFFTHCNLLCNFCQNYDISHEGRGEEVNDNRLADFMIQLQDLGCHNINFVTPTHVVPHILSALELAIDRGLQVPLVYNSGGYDAVETLQLLDGIVDIYMPDFKFWEGDLPLNTCNVTDYTETAKEAIREMYKQVGDLKMNKFGIAERGLLIRHLVMPNRMAGTDKIMKFLAEEISPDTYVNIMPQYRPCGMSDSVEGINRSISRDEYQESLTFAREVGLHRLDDRN